MQIHKFPITPVNATKKYHPVKHSPGGVILHSNCSKNIEVHVTNFCLKIAQQNVNLTIKLIIISRVVFSCYNLRLKPRLNIRGAIVIAPVSSSLSSSASSVDKNFNLAHNLQTVTDRAFFHMCIPSY